MKCGFGRSFYLYVEAVRRCQVEAAAHVGASESVALCFIVASVI